MLGKSYRGQSACLPSRMSSVSRLSLIQGYTSNECRCSASGWRPRAGRFWSALVHACFFQVRDPPSVSQLVRCALRLVCGGVVEDEPHALFAHSPIVSIDNLDQLRRQIHGELHLRL